MIQEKIHEFNKRCALFLDGTDNTFNHYFFPMENDEVNLSFDIFDETLFSNNGGSTWKIKDLKFHSDWNWIMKVVEKIQKTNLVVIINKYCRIHETTKTTFNDIIAVKGVKIFSEVISTKEAVIQTINEFLIFYYEKGNIKQ